jgi:hypothetical protein
VHIESNWPKPMVGRVLRGAFLLVFV